MNYPIQHNILTNFNTSIILPFYKKLADFERILPENSHYFEREGIEVIVVMDTPDEEYGLISLLKHYPRINWLVVINRKLHAWRNPAKAINVGIKVSTKEYIMVCSPESLFTTDAIFRLRYIQENYKRSFAIGKVIFSSYNSIDTSATVASLPYGSILVKKKHLEQIGGYTEGFAQWGGEDDNLRAKLEYIGLRKIFVPDAVLTHYEDEIMGHAKRSKQSQALPIEIQRKAYLTDLEDFQNPNWGTDFSEVIYIHKPI